MVVNRSEYKRRRKDEPDVLQESPKRTKVHAQRKFAQGSSTVTSPTLTPVKDKVKVNGSVPPAELLPAKRPHTEDFLTFLCFRGTRILPPRLNFFNTASVTESLDDDVRSAAGSSRGNAKQNKNSEQIPNNSDVDRGRNTKKPASAQDRAAKALKKKYLEQRLAKQKKTCLTKLAETVKDDRLSKTRSSARAAALEQKRKRNARIMAYNKARKAVITSPAKPAKPIVKRKLKSKQLRVGLRSGGQLPPGSDVGLKNPVRKTRVAAAPAQQTRKEIHSSPEKNEKNSSSPDRKAVKGKEKVIVSKLIATSLSDFSSDDDQPLVKKKNTPQIRQPAKPKTPNKEKPVRSKQQSSAASGSGVTNRPSRRTKEAAAVYMEMLGKDLRCPDEEYDDDALSVESFPELPNKKKMELREKELKAFAEKNQSSREELKAHKKVMKAETSVSKTVRNVSKPAVLCSKIDERNRRLLLRNKAKGKYLREKRKADGIRKRKRRALLRMRAAKEKVKEKSTSEVESTAKPKTSSPVRSIESRRSSVAVKPEPEKLVESRSRKQQIVSEKSVQHKTSPERSPSNTQKKQQASPEKTPIIKRATSSEKKTSQSKNDEQIVDQKKGVGKKSSEQPKKSSSTKNKSSEKEESGLVDTRNNSQTRKPLDSSVPRNSRSCSVANETKSSSKDDQSNDDYSDSDEEPLKNLTKKLKKEDVSVPATKTVTIPKKEEVEVVNNDSCVQMKPPKQRKQKTPQKKLVNSGNEKIIKQTTTIIGPDSSTLFQTSEHGIKKTPTPIASTKDLEKTSDILPKNKPSQMKEENKTDNLKPSCDDKIMKLDSDSMQQDSKQNETFKSDKKGSNKSLVSDEANSNSFDITVTHQTCVDSSPVKTELSTVFSAPNPKQMESSNKSVEIKVSSLSSHKKSEKIGGNSNPSNVETIENQVKNQSQDEKCSTDDSSNCSKKLVKDTVQSKKPIKVEESSPNEFLIKKSIKDSTESTKTAKVGRIMTFDEFLASRKPSEDSTLCTKSIKIEKRFTDESLAHKKSVKDSTQSKHTMKVEQNMSSYEASGHKKSFQGAKTIKVEENLSPDNSVFHKRSTQEPTEIQVKNENSSLSNKSLVKKLVDIPSDSTSTQSVEVLPASVKNQVLHCSRSSAVSDLLAVSERILQKPMIKSEDVQVNRTKNRESFPRTDLEPDLKIDINPTGVVSKNKSISRDDIELNKLGDKKDVKTDVKPVMKEELKPKIIADENVGETVDKQIKDSYVDEQVSCVNVGHGVKLPQKSDDLPVDSIKTGGNSCTKESDVSKSLVVPSTCKTPVKSTEVLPVFSPINPHKMPKPLSRPNASTSEIKKPVSRQSVNDTWRQAFRNAKIPKPGQSSPVMTDEKPFVRKPFTNHALKKQIQFDSKVETSLARRDTAAASNSNINLITPFAVNRNPFSVTCSGPIPLANTATVTASSVMPVVTVTMSTKDSVVSIPIQSNNDDTTRKQRPIDPDELRLKEAEIVEDIVRMYGDYEGAHKNLLIGSALKSEVKPFTQPIVHQTFNSSTTTERGKQIITFTTKLDQNPPPLIKPPPDLSQASNKILSPESSINNDVTPGNSPAKCASIASPRTESSLSGPGKHHNLPLPVEQTLKKLQTKPVTKKPIAQKTFQEQLLRKQQINCDKTLSPVASRSGNSLAFMSEFSSNSSVLNKKKVNMSTEEIKKWLNDSTSTGIEHTKDCGIFEKNQCECGPSFVEDKSSPLDPEPLTPLSSVDQIKTKVPDKKVSSVGVEIVPKIDVNKKITEPKKLEPEKVDKPVVVEDKCNVSKQFSTQTTSFVPLKTLDPPKFSSFEKIESKVSKVTVTPSKTGVSKDAPNGSKTEEDKELKVSIDSKPVKDGDEVKRCDFPSPSAHFSPPLSLPLPLPPPQNQHRDDTSSNDDSPEKSSSSSVQREERRSIFHQKRSVFRSRPGLSRSPSAFSPENESSVYAFEPDLPPTSTPFRRAKGHKEGRTSNATTDEEDGGLSSNSIAVQVNIDSEEVLECSTQTDDDDGEGHLFYIPIQRNNTENVVGSGSGQQVIQGVAVKLGTEGPDQRVIMSAKLVTKPRSTFTSTTTSRPLISRGESIGVSCKPEQKVKPLTMSSTHAVKPPVGTVQPTARVTATSQIPPLVETLTNQKSDQSSVVDQSQKAFQSAVGKAKDTSLNKTSQSSSVDKIDKAVAAADVVPPKTAVTSALVDEGTADKTTPEQEKGSQCDEMPALPDRRRKAHMTSMTMTSTSFTERARKASSSARKQSPAPVLSKKTRKSSPSVNRAGSADLNLPGPSNKAKRSKGRGVGSANDSMGIDARANLEEAPAFYPTEKEFQDPLEYIEKIRPLAEKYGICKVIPPANFKPECKVSDDMRFTAYNQYVHKMQQRWGPNVKEMLAIKRHLATQSINMTQPPWIGGMEVDLPRLYQTVQNCGGLREVMEKKRWTRVADAMRIPKFAQDRVTKLDDIYCKFLLPYDTLSHGERTRLFEAVELEWERRMQNNEDDDEEEDDDSESDDSCNLEECIVKGRNMALNAFYRIARNTMAVHFRNNDSPSAIEVETEFWNHVGSRQHHVCVHSGSIDSGAFGYGFPIVKNSSTSRHPWNLKVLTNNSGTILRSLGPLMGVTVPTLHVGMVFTACCWYRDPHGLPWIEYLHTGKSKIWYGIPDESSSAFRAAMMECVPRLCRDKSIWLASDTAMVSPHLLAKKGVQLCRTVQEPGQFIIVFPKAFTSSICTGYLVSESVYFAQPSWLSSAQSIFKDISDSSEPSMFSLERLLFSIASDARSNLDVLSQVLPMVEAIKESELNQRFELEKLGLTSTERILLSKARGKSRLAHDEDGDYECEVCRANLFLSVVTNSKDEGVYCLKHAIQHLKQKPSDLKHYSLLYTYNSDEFDEFIDKIKTRIELKSQKKQQNKSTAASAASSTKSDQH